MLAKSDHDSCDKDGRFRRLTLIVGCYTNLNCSSFDVDTDGEFTGGRDVRIAFHVERGLYEHLGDVPPLADDYDPGPLSKDV